jgi:hypothetical protein
MLLALFALIASPLHADRGSDRGQDVEAARVEYMGSRGERPQGRRFDLFLRQMSLFDASAAGD